MSRNIIRSYLFELVTPVQTGRSLPQPLVSSSFTRSLTGFPALRGATYLPLVSFFLFLLNCHSLIFALKLFSLQPTFQHALSIHIITTYEAMKPWSSSSAFMILLSVFAWSIYNHFIIGRICSHLWRLTRNRCVDLCWSFIGGDTAGCSSLFDDWRCEEKVNSWQPLNTLVRDLESRVIIKSCVVAVRLLSLLFLEDDGVQRLQVAIRAVDPLQIYRNTSYHLIGAI